MSEIGSNDIFIIYQFLSKTMKTNINYDHIRMILLSFFLMLYISANSQTTELNIGTATADITPAVPVALAGQMQLRIAKSIATPLKANVIALEFRMGDRSEDIAIMVACDVSGLPNELIKMVRNEVHKQLPDLDVRKILMTATHTHTAPVLKNDSNYYFRYNIPEKGVLQVEEYKSFFTQRVTAAILKAWKTRRPGSVTCGLSHAVVGYSRRVVYSDGSAQMYGNTHTPNFSSIEGMEDHDVNTLFFWDKKDKLIAVGISVSCPAQQVENDYVVNADYWHPVREQLKKRFGSDLCVVGWIAAAGDISTRPMYRRDAEERMVRLRNLIQLEEMGRRVVQAVEESYETVKNDRFTNVQLIHKVERLSLPMRLVTEKEYLYCKEVMEKAAAQIAADPKAADEVLGTMTWHRDVVYRYEKQKSNPLPKLEVEVHVLRLGDAAICSNEFELFTDYSIQIQARSNALQTFVIQLAGGSQGYLPTEKATNGGGYSAIIQSVMVGPEGGHILVEHTINLINDMFDRKN